MVDRRLQDMPCFFKAAGLQPENPRRERVALQRIIEDRQRTERKQIPYTPSSLSHGCGGECFTLQANVMLQYANIKVSFTCFLASNVSLLSNMISMIQL